MGSRPAIIVTFMRCFRERNVSLHWPKSSEHCSHGLIVDLLDVAPFADTVFDDRDGRCLFFRFSSSLDPGFVCVFLLLVGKGDPQHADIPSVQTSKLPALMYAWVACTAILSWVLHGFC